MKNYFFPKSVGEQWIGALRSRKYKQGKSCLYNSSTKQYCCLGVLSSLLKIEDIDKIVYLSYHLSNKDNVQNKIKNFLNSPCNSIDVEEFLATMNDSGKSFEEIANWLEQNLELEDE